MGQRLRKWYEATRVHTLLVRVDDGEVDVAVESVIWQRLDLLRARVVPDLLGRVEALGLVRDQPCAGLCSACQQQALEYTIQLEVLTVWMRMGLTPVFSNLALLPWKIAFKAERSSESA